MTEEKIELLKKMKIKQVHFAWDRYEDKEEIIPKFKMFARLTSWHYTKMAVYMLCNFNTTFEQDLPQGNRLRQLQRWVNNRIIFRTCDRFEDYKKGVI